jgi:hypothetical protein
MPESRVFDTVQFRHLFQQVGRLFQVGEPRMIDTKSLGPSLLLLLLLQQQL